MLTDLGGKRIDLFQGVLFEINNDYVTPIAVMSEKRSPGLPNVPTVGEAGFPNALANIWFGIFAPAGTPKDIVDKINKDMIAVMKTPAATEFIKTQAWELSDESSEKFAARVAADIAKWTAVAQKNGLRK